MRRTAGYAHRGDSPHGLSCVVRLVFATGCGFHADKSVADTHESAQKIGVVAENPRSARVSA